MEGLTKLIEIDSKWVPNVPNSALYIRPYMFATDAYIGVKPSDNYTFCIFCCPVGPYYNKALKVKIEQNYSRAVRGGTGYAKCAGNYAAALKPTALAQSEGFDQILWTDAIEHKYIEETGTTNIFLVFNGKIVTPEKSDTLLQGITRDSVIQIAKDMGLDLEERKISVDELVEGQKNGTLDEIFISGTAAAILNIDEFGFKSERFAVSADGPNKISARIKQHLFEIREGSISDMHEWRLKITHSSD
jgi:branched-chain amino acid aminotransferase